MLAVVAAALLVWNVSLQGGGESTPTPHANANVLIVDLTGQATGQVVFIKDQKLAVLGIHGLSDLPSDKAYEVWAISGSNARALGIVAPRDGTVGTTMPLDATGVDTIGEIGRAHV